MHTGSSETHQQKKEAVIAMLSTHWEDFIAALRNRKHSDAVLPYDLQELVVLLSDIICDDKNGDDAGSCSNVDINDAADEKGLLEKAKCIILKTHTLPEKKADPIVHKDGLFIIQTHEQSADLDPVFKDLVDSVL
ncbi:MAG: hypothetical protein ACTTH8_08135 [Treponema sp.]